MDNQALRLSDDARRVLSAAQVEARQLQCGAVDTPHILLGMLSINTSAAYHVLRSVNMEYDDVLAIVETMQTTKPGGANSMTPRVRLLLEAALEAARKKGQNFVGSEHLLAAMAQKPDDLIGRVFQQVRIDPAALSQSLRRVTGDTAELPQRRTAEIRKLSTRELTAVAEAINEPASPADKILRMVESGRLTPDDAAKLLQAVSPPAETASPTIAESENGQSVFFSVDEDRAALLRSRQLRVVLTNRDTGDAAATFNVRFDRIQTEFYNLLHRIYRGETGKALSVNEDGYQVTFYIE